MKNQDCDSMGQPVAAPTAKRRSSTATKRPKRGQLDKEHELARLYYFNGENQKAIAERTGVSVQTIGRWVKDGNWDNLRAAKTISRKELVQKMLKNLNDRLDEADWTPDELVKAAAAIEKLDKRTNVVTMMEVFAAFGNWLTARMKIDPDLSPETVQVITRYQDIFLSEQISSSKVNFI